MAYLGETIVVADTPPVDFSPIPSGEYVAVITRSEIRESKSGGKYLTLAFEILEGAHTHRMVWHNLNLWHENPTASEIARREVSAIAVAVGLAQISDSGEMHDKPMRIKVEYVPASSNGFPEKNRIKKFSAVTPSVAPAPVPKAVAAPKPRVQDKTPPWKKAVAEAIG